MIHSSLTEYNTFLLLSIFFKLYKFLKELSPAADYKIVFILRIKQFWAVFRIKFVYTFAGHKIKIIGKSSWRYEHCSSTINFISCLLKEKVLLSKLIFLSTNWPKSLNSHSSELSVFANNSTKAGVIVETMSAPNPVRISVELLLTLTFDVKRLPSHGQKTFFSVFRNLRLIQLSGKHPLVLPFFQNWCMY